MGQHLTGHSLNCRERICSYRDNSVHKTKHFDGCSADFDALESVEAAAEESGITFVMS